MRVFFDTNVLISAYFTEGVCADLLRHCHKHHQIVICKQVILEFQSKLVTKLKYSHEEAALRCIQLGMMVECGPDFTPAERLCSDKDDDVIIESAAELACQCLVTGDGKVRDVKKHRKTSIISPSEFWRFEAKFQS